ncbi:hypothetical protein J2Y69_003049 [Microbacterium resistens]|uniref:Uncharacterized protein n=1 Tax=Microbacterium resistens TaxID=156977 RepID=A0ABU1SHH8_9MICO|nr:hypothetical protein [Microbacterium resistens]MDR6868433.1 hypothetical protein [Microbacterium resistens]
MSFYRIQDRSIPVEQLLDPEYQISESYCTGTTRPGKSVCKSVEELAGYFAQAGVPLDPATSVLVEVEGTWATDEAGRFVEDEDAALGAHLVFPTRIVAVTEIPDEFYEAVNRFLDGE